MANGLPVKLDREFALVREDAGLFFARRGSGAPARIANYSGGGFLNFIVRITPVLILSGKGFSTRRWDSFPGSNNAAAENFSDDLGGFGGAVNAIVGELIGRQALGVERAKTGFIAKKWAAGHGHATCEEDFDG
jgi:hypothetical protein